MKVIFIRHGKTKGNTEGRYIGTTDESLADYGVEEISSKVYPMAERVIASPMKRCIQTANIVYKDKHIEIFDELKECSFGDFENKNYLELKDNKDYINWLESGGRIPFPNGEKRDDFCKRCCICFENIIRENKAQSIAFVVHGGTIMAILEKFEGVEFYTRQIKNGDYLVFDVKLDSGFLKLQQAE